MQMWPMAQVVDMIQCPNPIQQDSLSEQLLTINLSAIRLNPFQPRKFFEEKQLEELAQSIQAHGLIHPPLVRPIGDGIYELISGERRLQACKLAKLEKIPVYIRVGNEIAPQKWPLLKIFNVSISTP